MAQDQNTTTSGVVAKNAPLQTLYTKARNKLFIVMLEHPALLQKVLRGYGMLTGKE